MGQEISNLGAEDRSPLAGGHTTRRRGLRRVTGPAAAPVLVTGFGPFPGVPDNPSARVVEALLARPATAAGTAVVAELLPVDYVAVGPALEGLLDRHRPAAVLLTGARTSTDEVGIERVALNLDDAESPDVAGHRRLGTPVVAGGPPAYLSPLDLEALRRPFDALGIRAAISNHAGTYLCNRAYYLARHALAAAGREIPCVFVHLPCVTLHPVARIDGTPLALDHLVEAVAACAGALTAANAPGLGWPLAPSADG